MSSIYHQTSVAVNHINTQLAAPEGSENIVRKGGRVFARAVANALVTPLALVETVAYAALSILTKVFDVFDRTRPVHEWVKNHRIDAANGLKNAIAGVIGKGEVAKKEEPVATKKTFQEMVSECVAGSKAIIARRDIQITAAGIALVAIAGLAYFFYSTTEPGTCEAFDICRPSEEPPGTCTAPEWLTEISLPSETPYEVNAGVAAISKGHDIATTVGKTAATTFGWIAFYIGTTYSHQFLQQKI